jgi:hypothetical protein
MACKCCRRTQGRLDAPADQRVTAVTGDVQYQVQHGHDGQADSGPADHVHGLWMCRGENSSGDAKPSVPAAAVGRARWGLVASADQPQGKRVPVGLALAGLGGGQ